eukprot:2240012-Rhodomonas_salina.1
MSGYCHRSKTQLKTGVALTRAPLSHASPVLAWRFQRPRWWTRWWAERPRLWTRSGLESPQSG